jgi:succinoglycan biosynthesis protein ExoM
VKPESAMTSIAICLATYKRPDLLEDLLESFKTLTPPQGATLELRVVDNDREGSAGEIVKAFEGDAHPYQKIHYVVEPEQNIARARNRALDLGPADWIVFVDDDEVVEPQWLEHLWQTAIKTDADAVFGPVQGRLPKSSPGWMTRGRFFDKQVGPTGTRVDWRQTRTSNTFVRGTWFTGEEAVRFDPHLGRSGGSDSDLFSRIEARGGRFVTCAEAGVSEDVPPSRARFGWLWKRWYRNGLIYERIARTVAGQRHPFVRFTRRMGAAALMILAGLLPLLAGRPERIVRALCELSLGLGGLVAWLRPESTTRHVAYSGQQESGETPTTRVAFLTNIVSPYRKPVFERLAGTPGWDFRVFVDADREFDRKWQVDASGLSMKQTACLSWKRTVTAREPIPFKQVITLHFPYGLVRDLFKFRPDSVISLELGFRTALAALYCGIAGKQLVIWSYQSRVSGAQGSWRLAWRKWLLRRADRVVGMGTQAREVLEEWSVPASKIIDAPNAADHVTLTKCLEGAHSEKQIAQIRAAFARDRKLAIVVGRLIPLKGIEQILNAWKALPNATQDDWSLVFVGDGPLAELVEREANPAIRLSGFVESSQMACWYAAADLHIFPTCGDVWGLVVNEAGICGTPTLCSVHAGCFEDLIEEGRTGLAIDCTGSGAVDSLNAALTHPDLPEIGKAAQTHVAAFTLDRLAHSFRSAATSYQKSGNWVPREAL